MPDARPLRLLTSVGLASPVLHQAPYPPCLLRPRGRDEMPVHDVHSGGDGMTRMHIDAYRALNDAVRFTVAPHHGSIRWPSYSYRPGVIARNCGYVVTMASEHAVYAASGRQERRRVHLVRAVFMAWKRSDVVGGLVVCWCGTKLVTPELLHEIPDERFPCGSCEYRTGALVTRPPITVTVTVGAS